jgi:hypothetical protein
MTHAPLYSIWCGAVPQRPVSLPLPDLGPVSDDGCTLVEAVQEAVHLPHNMLWYFHASISQSCVIKTGDDRALPLEAISSLILVFQEFVQDGSLLFIDDPAHLASCPEEPIGLPLISHIAPPNSEGIIGLDLYKSFMKGSNTGLGGSLRSSKRSSGMHIPPVPRVVYTRQNRGNEPPYRHRQVHGRG